MGKRIKLECHKIENGGRIWGRECLSPGYECSQSALQYDDLCRAMNTAMSADLQKNVYQPKIGEVYVAEISSKKMRCRVEVLHILQGSVVHCLLVDFGVKELINVTSLTAIPAHWLSVPCQSQCYILDNLQPVTLATNTEDMITSLQPCRNWGQSASVFVANFIKDSTLIEAEILCTNNNFHHAKVYGLQLGVMLCLNDLLVEEQYAVPLIKTGIEVGTDERQSQPDLITDTGLTHPNVKSVAQSLTNQSSLPDIMCGSNVHSSMHTNQSHLTEKKSQPVNPTDVMCTVAISPSRVASVATNSPVTSPMSTNNSIDHTTDSEYDTSTTSHSNSITFDGPTEPALSKIPLKPRGIFALIRPKVPDPPKSNRFSSRISMLGASTTPIVAPTPESAKVSSLVNITSPRTHAMEPEVMAPNMSTVLTTSGKGSTCMSPPMPGPIEPTIRFGMQSPTEPRSAARPSSYRFAEPKSSVLQTGENKSSMMKPTAPVMPCHNDPIRTATVTRPDMPCFTRPTHKPVMFPPTVTTRAPLRPAGVRHGLRPPSSRLKLKSASFPTSRDSSTSRPPPVVKTTPQRNNYTFAGLSDSSEDSCGYPTMMPKLLHSTNSQVSAIKQINESLSSDGRSSNVTNPSAQTHKEIVDQCSMSTKNSAVECSLKMPALCSMSESDIASDCSPNMPALCSMSESDKASECSPKMPGLFSMSGSDKASECSPKMPGLFSMSGSDKASDYSPKMPALCSQSESDSTHEYKPPALKQKTSFDMQIPASELSMDPSYNISHPDGDSDALNPSDILSGDSVNITNPTAQLPDRGTVAQCSMSTKNTALECSPTMPGLCSMSESDKSSECSPKMPALCSQSESDKASDYSPKMPALCSQSESDSTHEYKPPALKQKTSFDMQIPASELSMDPSYNISHPDGDSDALNPSDILSGDSVNITNPTAQLPDRETVAQCSMSTKNTALECSPKMPGLCSMSESDKFSDYSPKMPALCSQSESDSTHEYKPPVLKQKTSFDMQMSASNLSKDASYNIPSLDGDFGDSGTLNPLDKLCEDSHNSAHNLISSPTPEKSVGNVTLKTAEATKTSIDDRTLELVNLVDSCVLDRWKEELEQLSSAEQETQQNGVGSNFAATDIRETKDPGTSVNPIDLIKEAHEKGILALNNTGELLKPGFLSRKEMKDIFTAMQQVRNDSNVLISASLKLKTIYHIADTNFPNRLLQMLRDMDVTQPLWIQGYVWDVIWRGLDLVAITPQGRSMSYIPPLIANLMDSQSYTYLPAGKWPILIILCGSIERAQSVYHTVNLFTKGLSAINSICVYGGGAEAMQEVNLLNGCSILVATPDCLLRLKARKIVYFTHLCHLVLDGEDLVEDFAPQVDELIAEFRGVQDCDDRFNQLVLIAKKYSPSMELFIARHMPDPYVVIGDKLEAAVFGNIKQEVRLVDDRVSYLCELLSNSVTAHQRVVVTTSDMTTASHVKQMLTSCMNKCIFILDEDNISDLTTIVQAFTTTQADQPILVCTDGVLDKIRLTCADVVIHYDLPKKHCNFANRLWCMREKFNTKVNLDQNLQVSSCYSHILLTKADSSMAPNLVIHLERTKSEIPADVKAIAQHEIKQRELCKSTPLCVNLKMFGYCRTQFYCSQRHLICKDLDRSNKGSIYMNLPTQGHIQVLVLHVVNASRYYVRLIQHTDTHGTDVSHSYAALAMRMATLTDRYKIFTPVHGEMYAIKDNYGVFHRVVCIDLEEPDYVGTVAHVKVQRIDIGNEMVVRTSELCRLPLELKNIPRQAVEVISCRIQPYDNDVVWTLKATQKVVEELQGKTMTGSIVLSLGNTLWLDPLVKKEILHGIKERIISFNVRQDLIRQKLAIRNPQHLDLLYAVCEGVIDVPTYRSADIVFNSHNVPVPLCVQNLGGVSLDSQSSYQPIIVSAVHDEGVVFVQLLNMQDRLQKFQAEMQSVMLVTDLETKNIRLGSLVAARYPDGDPTEDITITEDDYINPKGHLEKNDWFRAKVLSCHNDNTYTVLFLDYGDNAHIHARDIAVLPTYLAHFPCQAVECKLYSVDYSNLTDPISAADVLFDLTTPGDEEIEDKKLLAKVHSIEPAVHVGTDCHLVSIMDTNNTYDVDIAQYMVLLGHYSLCPKYLDKIFDCGDSNLVSLVEECRLLYSASTPKQDELLSIAESISHQIVADFPVADADTKAHLSRIVVHLISWLPHTAVVKHILHNLHSVVDIEDMALLMNTICYYLDKTQYSSLHESLLPYLNTLASHKQHASSLLSIGAVRILTKLTDVADRRMKDNYLYTIDGILQHYDDSFVERLLSSECVSMFCEFLLLNSDDDLTLQSLQTLAHILHSERIQVSFRKLDGIKYLVKLLEFNRNAEIQKQCLHLTQSLICGNKDLFKSLNAVDVIQGLLSQFAIDTEIFTICTQIIASLRTTVQKVMQIEKQTDSTPEPQKILHKRLQLRDGPVKRMTPRTCWTQDRYNVLISVDIPDLEISRDMICDFLQDKLVFRCKVDNIEYHLQLELYELLDTSECKSYEHINHKYFGLRKLKHFRWPRLTKDKKKMYNVMVDISRISLNSDSSDCDEDQTIPDSLSLVKKYNTSGSITDALCSTRGGVSAHEPPVLQSSTSTDNSTEEDSDEFWDDESLERRNNDQY